MLPFIDEVDILVRAGKGGNGCCSFRREKYVPHGGPDGGNGGDGGSVIFIANQNLLTLQDIVHKKSIYAEDGSHGQGKGKHGKSGDNTIIQMPPGTVITDAETGLVLRDLQKHDDAVVVARGGAGGRGNATFKSATNQVPKQFEEGQDGEEKRVHLELKLIADIGIVGFPNAGKSTLLRAVSHAKPKVAAYPFTTLTPHLGIMQSSTYDRLVVADVPGIIEGAHEGTGLGNKFLRHLERTAVLLLLIDISVQADQNPIDAYNMIMDELGKHTVDLRDRVKLVVGNKIDFEIDEEACTLLEAKRSVQVLRISAKEGIGVEELKEKIFELRDSDDTI